MTETMKALVKFDSSPGHMEIRDLPIPKPGPHEVLIRVKACGVDRGGDLYIWKSDPAMRFKIPVVVGAENCGEVAAVGEAVADWHVGDRVVSEVVVGKDGGGKGSSDAAYLFQEERWDIGRNVDGAFAEYFAVHERFVHAIPDNVSWRAATLFEMAAVVVRNLVEVVGIPASGHVAVIGPGPIGNIAAQVVKASGATPVLFGMQRDVERFEIASSVGVTEHLIVDAPDFKEQLAHRFPNGFPLVVEGSGGQNAMSLALDLAASQGTIAMIGGSTKESTVNWVTLLLKELKIQSTYAHTWSTWELTAKMAAAGKLNLEPLVSKAYPLEDWETAFQEVDTSMDVLKVAICPGELI
ncbi:zinc-binding dehydrogenase [Diaminobutyricimonas sp. LJ205]|uniref:zinc-dependent alcohol dehydrogenase n=1 Tax=Diaminobutyricimonas sp. LJ205 TaxID=2683590 RepID=UPI0012F50C20|nr:alcohol dehydrogenase catalytic domain-containing protein [Diaminobutyricimonas sp. LJ205]